MSDQIMKHNALNMALCADAAYFDSPISVTQRVPSGVLDMVFLANGSNRALILRYPGIQVLAIRGTDGLDDFKANLNALRFRGTHNGFEQAANEILEACLTHIDPNVPCVVTGHSLGGAIAALVAIHPSIPTEALYTYGQPRVFGWKQRPEHKFTFPYIRVTNGSDVVPRVPPVALGYKHRESKHVHFNRKGRVVKRRFFTSLFDRVADYAGGLLQADIEAIDDHMMAEYIGRLAAVDLP